MNAGPTPNRREMRPVTNDPRSVPTDAAPSTSPSVAGSTPRLARRVEHEEGEVHEVEEVERRDAEQLGANDRVAPDPAHAGEQRAALGRRARRLLCVDAAEEERRPEERDASSASAYGPRKICTRTPPRLLPARNENARLPWMSELACT